LRLEYQQKVENLEEKCSDLTYQNQMLNAKLNSQIAVSKVKLDYERDQPVFFMAVKLMKLLVIRPLE